MAPRVLVVDDDPPTRDIVALLLRDCGLVVDACSSATEALAKLARAAYDAVVTDHMMPEMTGLELVGGVRTRWPATKCVVLSGYEAPAAVETTWLTKPLDLGALLDALGA
jgi:CheY-like chemotaxis protein